MLSVLDAPSTSLKLQKRQPSFENEIGGIEHVGNKHNSCQDPAKAGSWEGNTIGVFTSGGDAQGMNAAVRAIVRVGIYVGAKIFYIKEGYQGMVDGGDNIVQAEWGSTSNIIHIGGTAIGSARCMDFKERWGRLQAAKNLISHGITNLIAIGGDGSLTGANMFRQEWASLLRELVDSGQVSSDKITTCSHLNIVGLVGSIDNDFCGTDMTIGVDSALHRIIEAVDEIMTTAVSHKRAFVLEIMGRMCGYLPLVAGICSEATMVFVPEDPPSADWRQTMCDHFKEKSKTDARRTQMVLVAEGAIDKTGQPIKCSDVQKALTERLNLDVRVTVLGHIQRGGKASAFDRTIATRMGAEAVFALMDATPETPACVITLDGVDVVRSPLMKCVEVTKMVGQRMNERNFDEVVKLRGRSIKNNLYIFQMQRNVQPHAILSGKRGSKKVPRIAMIHNGHPACGMNAVARGFVGICVSKGFEPLFVYDSWQGLLDNNVQPIEWPQVQHFTAVGGSYLGTSPATVEKVGICQIATAIHNHEISGIIIVGGFEAFQSACDLMKARDDYPELCIPINVVPVTISNNVPGVRKSIGSDTAINQICKQCDGLKMSASSIKKCVYVVETGGDNCGYLATLATISAGADASFIHEVPHSIRDVADVCKKIKSKMQNSSVKQGLVLRNQNANEHLDTDFIYRLFNEEGKPEFVARQEFLGGTQSGNITSPYDRCLGIKAGCRSAAWMILAMEQCTTSGKVFTNSPSTVTVTTMSNSKEPFVSVSKLMLRTDFEKRLPKDQWWLKLRNLNDILSYKF